MEIDGDKIRIEFAVNADDLEANPPHEFDFVDWNAALKEWLEPQEDNRNDEPTVPVSGVRCMGASYAISISNRYWITKPFLPFTSRNLSLCIKYVRQINNMLILYAGFWYETGEVVSKT